MRQWATAVVLLLALAAVPCLAQKKAPKKKTQPKTGTPSRAAANRPGKCGVTFALPAGWRVAQPDPDAGECFLSLQPAKLTPRMRDDLDIYSIEISVVSGDLERDEVKEQNFFEERGDKWSVKTSETGSYKGKPGVAIDGPDWKGVRGESDARCYHGGNKPFSGVCDVFVAAVSNGSKTALLKAGPRAETQFNAVVKSIRFAK